MFEIDVSGALGCIAPQFNCSRPFRAGFESPSALLAAQKC
jgi:hypothetical protein